MLISVIVATFNRPALLGNALDSIALQAGCDFEVVVVNDGGEDVGAIAKRFERTMPLTYIALPVNSGLATARNVALRAARGDVFCFLDDDDAMLSGHLQSAAERMARGDMDVYCTHVAVCDRLVTAGSCPCDEHIKARYGSPFDARLLMVCNFLPVNAVFVRRSRDIEMLFDEALPQLEDWELWLRLHQRMGYRFECGADTTAVYHRLPGVRSMTAPSRCSVEGALLFQHTFRQVVERYPSDDPVVRQGRALHEQFYSVLANACRQGRELEFPYERFVRSMEELVAGAMSADDVMRRISSW